MVKDCVLPEILIGDGTHACAQKSGVVCDSRLHVIDWIHKGLCNNWILCKMGFI